MGRARERNVGEPVRPPLVEAAAIGREDCTCYRENSSCYDGYPRWTAVRYHEGCSVYSWTKVSWCGRHRARYANRELTLPGLHSGCRHQARSVKPRGLFKEGRGCCNEEFHESKRL